MLHKRVIPYNCILEELALHLDYVSAVLLLAEMLQYRSLKSSNFY